MPSIALPVSLRGQLLSGTRTFSPASLFSANEPGVWFDPSDLATLFTDPAGTTPVTAPGNTVGLMLDKSRGLALGPEVVVNGNFATDTDWTKGAGWTISGGVAIHSGTATGNLQQNVLTAGRTYKITMNVSGGTVLVLAGGGAFTGAVTGSVSAILTATGPQIFIQAATDGVVVDSVSYRELAGNHATQATLASRPIYGIEPVGGRRNLLTYSEQFDVSAYWTVGTLTVTPNAASAPDGTLSADLLYPSASGNYRHIRQASFNPWAGTYTFSFYAKAAGIRFLVVLDTDSTGIGVGFDLQSGTYAISGIAASDGTTASITPVGDGWYRCAYTSLNGYGYLILSDTISGPAVTTSGTNGIFLWGAQLELGSTATAYQKVTTQYDVTEAGVASVSYLYFDGASDNMVTSTITPGTDKAQVFAGVRKLSDALESMLLEFSVNSNTNNGSFQILGPDSNATSTYRFYARGDTANTGYVPTGYAAPVTNVIASLLNFAGADRATEVIPRINGVLAQVGAAGSGSAGGGNFAAYPLYLGGRAGTSVFFTGHLYSLITRFGANLDAPTITSTEIWVAGKTGIDVAKNISTTIYTRSGDTILDRANSTIERRAV